MLDERLLKEHISLVADGEYERIEAESRAEDQAYADYLEMAKVRLAMRARRLKERTTFQTVSEFVEHRFCYDLGQHISFHLRPWLPAIYNMEYTKKRSRDGSVRFRRNILMKTARQCEKSTMLGNKILSLTALSPNTTALYVSSATLNMIEFADERIENTLRISPQLRNYVGQFQSYNRYLKRYKGNNSKIVMRSANLNANRVRGIAADVLAIDEVQDFTMSNIPVIRACLNNSPMQNGAVTLIAGTPLSFDNPIEQIWSKLSTQNMWLMKCSRCNHWNPPLPKQVGPLGLVCEKCGKALSPFDGQWVPMGSRDATYEGFHLSRALMPYKAIADPEQFKIQWGKFYEDFKDPTVEDAQKLNEMFGVSADSGSKPITQAELQACCWPGMQITRLAPPEVLSDPSWPIFAGIDWGSGQSGESFTVLCMGFMNGEKFQVFYLKRFMGIETGPKYVAKDVARSLEENGVMQAICDAGFSWGILSDVREKIQEGINRLIPCMYASQSAIANFDETANMLKVHRTRWMARVFQRMKEGAICFPDWEIFAGTPRSNGGFAQDIMTIHADRSPKQRMTVFNHTDPDDAFHAILYAYTAALLHYGDLFAFANA